MLFLIYWYIKRIVVVQVKQEGRFSFPVLVIKHRGKTPATIQEAHYSIPLHVTFNKQLCSRMAWLFPVSDNDE